MTPAKTGAAPRRALPAGQVARKRTRKKAGGAKRGKVSWIHGTKLVFFEKRAEEWKVANDMGVVQLGRFYTKITNLYLLKYGHEMEDDEDLKDDVEDPTNPDAALPGSENLTEEEATAHSENTIRVRKRIAAWYCRKYRGVEQAEKELFADLLGGVVSTGPGYPRKAQPIHLYSRKYYEDRVKVRFEQAWEAEKHRAEGLEREPEAEIKIRNIVTREVFEEETEEFKEELAKAVEAEHSAAIRAWELTCADTPAKTAAEINAVHAGTTKTLTPQKWHQFDKMGYDTTVKSFVRFSERCFSEEECQSRIVDEATSSSTSTVLPPARRPEVESPGASQADAAASSTMGSGAIGARDGAQCGPESGGGGGSQEDGADSGGGGGGADSSGGGGGERDAEGEGNDDGGGAGERGNEDGPNDAGDKDQEGDGERGGVVVRPEFHPVWHPDEEVWEAAWGPEVKKAFASFATRKREFGGSWAKLVDAWLKLEEASGFDNEGGKLTTEGRPKEVTEFINKGRHWIMVRKIDAPGSKDTEASYAAQWWGWWEAIERKEDLHTMHGRMGFMLVVLSLLWWGAGELGVEWEAAVAAVTTTLEELVASGKVVKSAARPKAAAAAGRGKAKGKRGREEKENEEEDEGEGRVKAKRQKRVQPAEEETRVTRSKATTAERPLLRCCMDLVQTKVDGDVDGKNRAGIITGGKVRNGAEESGAMVSVGVEGKQRQIRNGGQHGGSRSGAEEGRWIPEKKTKATECGKAREVKEQKIGENRGTRRAGNQQ
ncbi:hypothetical protein C8F04DRAFT_1200386 [Mycena alexandri]|uniref:Uncharacterized protein n=1 Tax=Mycena alexandri TaxID=1745969 RepID=A0AAD6RY66_9AGAR|nr:hypothetical protein C8F04DRAFT_1200386 [Mycena alexandri]